MAKIFAVEDDENVLSGLKKLLEYEHHAVETCSDGREASLHLRTFPYDLIILDWQLPNMAGVEICKQFRQSGGKTPVLMLTGKNTIEDKEFGFDSGADDYLTKPFDSRELTARVKALLRRPPDMSASVLSAGNLTLDTAKYRVTIGTEAVDLLPKEFQLLEFLLRHPNHAFGAEDLLNRVWPSESESTPEALRSTVKRLRKKVDPEGKLIETLHGVGYILRTY